MKQQLVEHSIKDIVNLLGLNDKKNFSLELLQNAEFFQYGSALFIKVNGESAILLADFFTESADYFFYYSPESGLPVELGLTESSVYYLSSEQVDTFLDVLGNDSTDLKSSNFDSMLLSTLTNVDDLETLRSQQNTTKEPQEEGEETSDEQFSELVVESDTLIEGEELTLAQLDFSGTYGGLIQGVEILGANESPINDASSGEIGSTFVDPGPVLISRIGNAVGTIGTPDSGLSSVSGDSGTLVSRASVDGLAGTGESSSVSGSLGADSTGSAVDGSLNSFNTNSVAPPSDAFSAAIVSPPGFTHTINIDGLYSTSVVDLNIDLMTAPNPNAGNVTAGTVWTTIVNIESLTSDSFASDSIDFSDNDNWIHKYKEGSFSQTVSQSIAGNSTVTVVQFDAIDDITEANRFTLSLSGGPSFDIDLSATNSGEEVAAAINNNSAVSADGGIVAGWYSPDPLALDNLLDFLTIVDKQNRVISQATLIKADTNDLDTNGETFSSVNLNNLSINFFVDGSTDPNSQKGNFYTPVYRHGSEIPVVDNTNITRYQINGSSSIDKHYAVSGAGDTDFVFLDSGSEDIDTLSFYNKNDPINGNGDYDLVTNDNYLKIQNVEILEARGYGTNTVVLNKTALKSMTEEMKTVTDNGDGTYTVDLNTDRWTLSVAGDSFDTVSLTDESLWQYNGFIDLGGKTLAIVNANTGTTGGSFKTISSTRSQYGNILYQFQSDTGGENYYLNMSADILDHPDWYWSGTAGDEAYELPDTQFGSVDFGAGIDTLEMNSGLASKTQDFTGEGSDLSNVEIINFSNSYFIVNSDDGVTGISNDSVTLDLAFTRGATDSNNTLSLIGDSIDTVNLSDIATNWHYLGEIAGSGGLNSYTFKQYQYKPGSVAVGDEQVTLNIQTELASTLGEYYRGWDGDDGLKVFSMSFDGIEGGAGTDTLRVDSATQDYTQAGIAAKINNIEVIDGNGHSGATTITVNTSVITTMTDANNQLTLLGESSVDHVILQDTTNWNYYGEVTAFGETLYQYKSLDNSQTLNVQKNLATTPGVFFNGDNNDNNFFAPDLEFSSLDGKGGTDWLFIQTNDYDFTGADSHSVAIASKIDNLEVIDARDNSSNQPGAVNVILNAATVAAIAGVDADGFKKLTIMGDADDSVSLSDLNSNWSWIGLVDGIDEFTGKQFYQYQTLDGNNAINIWDNINTRPEVRAIGDIGGVLKHDIIQVEDSSFALVDGKTGTDTLQITQTGAVDLTGFGAKINNIEVIDITGNATTLTLDADFVQQVNSTANLVVTGDNGDTLSFADAAQWRFAGSLSASGPWSDLHAYEGTATDGGSTWLYADTNLGAPLFDAIGTSANDLIQLLDKEDANVDGLAGFDTLELLGNNATINFGSGKTIQSIEQLKLGNASQQTVSFDLSSVDNADNNSLYVQGDSNLDTINATAGADWVLSGRKTFTDAPDMYQYQAENAGQTLSLFIQTDLIQGLYHAPTGTAGSEDLWVLDDQFGLLDTSTGFDRLLFAQQGAIDLSNGNSGNTLKQVEAVDMTNGVSNTLTLSTDTVILSEVEKNEFYILGENADELNLNASDNWTQGSSYQVNSDLTWDSYSSSSNVSGQAETATIYVDANVGVNVV